MSGDSNKYHPRPTPTEVDLNLLRYLQDELHAVKDGFDTTLDIEITNEAPQTPKEGMLRIADGTGWNPDGTGKGLFIYTGSAWMNLASW